MFGTKCPSITSRWIQSAPAASTARISSPSLEKSAAKIDGAMTRGRDANGWDIGASRCSLGDAEWHSRNMRDARGQCARHEGLWAGKICRERHQLPGRWVRVGARSPAKYGVFAMARRLLRNLRGFYAPLMQRPKSEFCHVACPWRCVVGDRRPQGADVVKAAVARQP